MFQVFDVLSIDGTGRDRPPYEQRRRLLADLLEPGGYWTVPGHRIGGGADLLAAAADATSRV